VTSTGRQTKRITDRVRDEMQAYDHGHERPLGSFLVIMGAYGAALTGMAAFLAARGRRLPDRLGWSDLALLAVATHKASRQLAKDPVTSPLRAAFTRYSGTSAEAELAEEVRGAGVRKALGELVSCPFCLGQWVATTGVFGLIVAPRATRAIASVFAVLAGSDMLQYAYVRLQES
jgi:Protein of unknown function (DUF1360)